MDARDDRATPQHGGYRGLTRRLKSLRRNIGAVAEEIDYVFTDLALLAKGIEKEITYQGSRAEGGAPLATILRYLRMEIDQAWPSQIHRNLHSIDRFFGQYSSLGDDRITVLFQVHGYAQIPYIWETMNLKIRSGNLQGAFDKKILPIPLGYYFFQGIEDNVEAIRNQITFYLNYILKTYQRRVGRIAAVGHSKGGLILNYYMKERLFERVPSRLKPLHISHVVCIASPHNGTYAAFLEDVFRPAFRLARVDLVGGRETKPYSDFLKKVHAMDLPGLDGDIRSTDYTIIRAGILDPMVFNRFTHPQMIGGLENWLYDRKLLYPFLNPRRSAIHSKIFNYAEHKAIPQVKRVVLDKFGHCPGIFSPEGLGALLENVGVRVQTSRSMSSFDAVLRGRRAL